MSTTTRLPELPEARIESYQTDGTMRTTKLTTYDEFDMHAYGLAVWKAAIQHAADHCQERSRDWIGRGNTVNWEYRAHGAEECAESLLALPLPEQGSPQ